MAEADIRRSEGEFSLLDEQRTPAGARFGGLKRFPPDLNRGIPKGIQIRESLCIDSPVGAMTMPKSLSGDLRERVIEAVQAGASRREAAEGFEISASTAVKWLQR